MWPAWPGHAQRRVGERDGGLQARHAVARIRRDVRSWRTCRVRLRRKRR